MRCFRDNQHCWAAAGGMGRPQHFTDRLLGTVGIRGAGTAGQGQGAVGWVHDIARQDLLHGTAVMHAGNDFLAWIAALLIGQSTQGLKIEILWQPVFA